MSLMSKSDVLKAKAQQEGASELDLMRAALVESQERYNKQAAEIALTLKCYDKRLEALELAMRQSNKEKGIDVSNALKEASEAVLADINNKIGNYGKEIDKNIANLQLARKETSKKEKADDRETLAVVVGCVIAAAFVGGYLANLAWGAWYDFPAKLDAINNAAYLYTQSNK